MHISGQFIDDQSGDKDGKGGHGHEDTYGERLEAHLEMQHRYCTPILNTTMQLRFN